MCKNFTFHQLVQCVWRICEMMISHNLTVYVQLHTWFLSLSIRILHRLINLSLKKKKKTLFKFLSACTKFQKPLKKFIEQWEKKKLNITNKIFFFFTFRIFFRYVSCTFALYHKRDSDIYLTDDYMYCRLALFYTWRMIRVR